MGTEENINMVQIFPVAGRAIPAVDREEAKKVIDAIMALPFLLDFLVWPALFVVCYVAPLVEIGVILAIVFNNGFLLLTGFLLIPAIIKLGQITNADTIVLWE